MSPYIGLVVGMLVGLGVFYYVMYAERRQHGVAEPPLVQAADSRYRVLILTAAVGGGHQAAGQALQLDIEQAGHCAMVHDGMHLLSPLLDRLVRNIYAGQLKHRPQSAGLAFTLTSHEVPAAMVRSLIGFCFGHRLVRLIQELQPDLVVSTYPLVTSALGYLRGQGSLDVPVAALIPDYGVHPLWVAPHADLHLVASRLSEELVERAGGKAMAARLPVGPAFRTSVTRATARQTLGLPAEPFMALIVGGAWGAGDIEGMTEHVAQSGAYTVVVTGHNRTLQQQLAKRFAGNAHVHILGWTDEIRMVMAAADCIIQNAGGMTCLEAVEVQLPIVLFDPIRGHGEYNALVMEGAGVACWPRTSMALEALLRSVALGEHALTAPHWEAAPPAALLMLALAQGAIPVVAPDHANHTAHAAM